MVSIINDVLSSALIPWHLMVLDVLYRECVTTHGIKAQEEYFVCDDQSELSRSVIASPYLLTILLQHSSTWEVSQTKDEIDRNIGVHSPQSRIMLHKIKFAQGQKSHVRGFGSNDSTPRLKYFACASWKPSTN